MGCHRGYSGLRGSCEAVGSCKNWAAKGGWRKIDI